MVKSIKMFMAVAAMALIAVAALGASSASATLLCKENVTTCAEKDIYPSGTSLSATIKGKFELSGNLSVTCTGSALSGETKAEKDSPLPIEFTGLTLSGCSGCPFGAVSTTGEATTLPYSATLARTTEDNGTVTVANGGKGTPTLKFICTYKGGAIPCAYSINGLQLKFDGGGPAMLVSEAQKISRVEGDKTLCGTDSTLNATYEVTSPNPAHVSLAAGADDTVFCKAAGPGCAPSSIYAKETAFEGSATGVFLDKYTRCDLGMSFKNSSEGGKPLPLFVSSVSFTKCEEFGCEATAAHGAPYAGSATATLSGNGKVTLYNFEISRTCGPEKCIFRAQEYNGTFTGGSTPNIAFGSSLFETTSGGQWCGKTWTVNELKFNITSPTPVYMTKRET